MTGTLEARARLFAQQRDLVRSLVGAGPTPPGFDAERIKVTLVGLHEKRRFALKKVWPGLAHGLGEGLGPVFDAYAEDHQHPNFGHGLADGLLFAQWLERQHKLPDEGKLELLDVRLRTVKMGGKLRARRSPAFGAVILRNPRRIVFGLYLPGIGAKCFALGSPTAARRSARPPATR
jgi:hypothetical protein